MLDIHEMVRMNDFSPLLFSTQEERDECGGNKHLYKQLDNYMHFEYIREIAKHAFKEDKEILEDIEKRYE